MRARRIALSLSFVALVPVIACASSNAPVASSPPPAASSSHAHALVESGSYGAVGALAAQFGSTSQSAIAFDSESNETIGSASSGGWGDAIGLGSVGGFGKIPTASSGSKPTKMIDPGVTAEGKLPPDAIQHIVRANFPRFRACYEVGLKKNAALKGTVTVFFVIDSTGAVASANVLADKSTLADADVRACVKGVYQTLSFPEPEGGSVKVTYPIDFENDD